MSKKTECLVEDRFVGRHIGPRAEDMQEMLSLLQQDSLESFVSKVIPHTIKPEREFTLREFNEPLSEREALKKLRLIASENKLFRSFIGMGYYATSTPSVIARNILENPGWYTQYTPYQPEISQGRLAAMLNFQTMVSDLTALPIANASLLDEGTAAAEAMSLSYAVKSKGKELADPHYFVSDTCHPQTIAIMKTRAEALGIKLTIDKFDTFVFDENVFGVLLQYPDTYGSVNDYSKIVKEAHAVDAVVTVASDLLALALLKPPGEFGADICVGNSQRFGVPLGFGGPHAAFISTRDEFKRLIPGRIVGVSKDKKGRSALRLSLQTREQHIRRERATSNICTAQVLLAVMAGMYAVYHGPAGIRRIANKVHTLTDVLAKALKDAGYTIEHKNFFDTLEVSSPDRITAVLSRAENLKVNLRVLDHDRVCLSLDEVTDKEDLNLLAEVFGLEKGTLKMPDTESEFAFDKSLARSSDFLTHEVFNSYRSETEFLRYIRRLESQDLSLTTSMIPLGSCTMKLNATSEMLPVSWPEFSSLHPFVPLKQAAGYLKMFSQLEEALCDMTAFSAVSLQPNAGSQGEYAGLLAIRGYHKSRGDMQRNVCLIPRSAHGTNPASAVMAGMKVVAVDCDDEGNIDIADLRSKAEKHKDSLSALMVTYPSTHGVFEEGIKDICAVVHEFGGQVYMDGANLNALLGMAYPAEIGADVCHFNLHKTFCIPHGGGGPGLGPIGVKKHLEAFLPSHPLATDELEWEGGAVSAAPWGSPSILTISWVYIAMMGASGLKRASEVAILNANYIAKRLESHYPVLFKGRNGFVAHECILDLRAFKKTASVEVEDVAKRLMDYGFHAPTVSWPVPGTVMVEPTESESKEELDRFCDAMIAIREEIRAIEKGEMDVTNNPLKNAPHTAQDLADDEWQYSYSRAVAAFPSDSTRRFKFWPAVNRIDASYGDRNLVCTCPPIEEFEK